MVFWSKSFVCTVQYDIPDMTLAIEENVLWLAVPVDNTLLVEVAQPQQDLCRVEPATNILRYKYCID